MFGAQTMAGSKTNAVGSVKHIQTLKLKCTFKNENKKDLLWRWKVTTVKS